MFFKDLGPLTYPRFLGSSRAFEWCPQKSKKWFWSLFRDHFRYKFTIFI